MEHPIHNHVRDLSIGFGMNYLLLSVDRIFVRERVKKVGDPPRVIKEHESVDMLCWDAEVGDMHLSCKRAFDLCIHFSLSLEASYFLRVLCFLGYTGVVQACDR